MTKKFEVAKWEFLEKVKSKAFMISLLILPLVMVLFGFLPGLLASKSDEKPVVIGVIDETKSLIEPLNRRLEEKYRLPDGQPNYILRNLGLEGGLSNLKNEGNALVSDGSIEGYIYVPSSVYDSGRVEYRAENAGNIRVLERFSRTINEVITESRLTAQGLDPKAIKKLIANVNVKSIKISGEEEKESGFLQTFFSAYVVIMMLMFLVLTSGQLLIRSVVEEKSSRVIEVLLSSCSAKDLMVGKILGLSGLGILQVMIWGLIAAGIALKFQSNVFSFEQLGLSFAYLILGYLMYSAIFVGAGSPATTEQEAQQITSYVSLILVFPIVLAVPAMQNPDSTLIKILTFIPLLTPAFMILRISIQMPSAWEIVTTLALLAVSSVVLMWAAGKIFRTAILVYGKRPTIPELWRWLRAA